MFKINLTMIVLLLLGIPIFSSEKATKQEANRNLWRAIVTQNSAQNRKLWEVPTIEEAIKAGADVNARGTCADGSAAFGSTPLIYLAGGSEDNSHLMKILLAAGADINAKGDDQETAAFANVRARRNVNNLKVLLEHGYNINEMNGDSFIRQDNLANVAIVSSNPEALQLVLDWGIDTSYANKCGRTIFSQWGCNADQLREILEPYKQKKQIHKAAKQPAQLTEEECKKFGQFPKGIACEIAGFVVGELTPQERVELQAEIEREELPTAPGGPGTKK